LVYVHESIRTQTRFIFNF